MRVKREGGIKKGSSLRAAVGSGGGPAEAVKRIVVVSLGSFTRELLRVSLMEEGYKVSLAGGVREAFERCQEDPPDLLLIDTVLSDIDDAEVLRRFRGGKTPFPVVVWSASDAEDDSFKFSDIHREGTRHFLNVKKMIKKLVDSASEEAEGWESEAYVNR